MMQDDFTDLEKAAWGGFLGVHARLMRLIDADMRERAGISHGEFEILLRLSWAEGRALRIQELAATSRYLTRSGISRAVERLERAGHLRRERAPEDGRGARAVLTRGGLALLQRALSAHADFVRSSFLGRFSESELGQLASFWKRF